MENRWAFLPYLVLLFLIGISMPVVGNGTVEPDWYEAPFFILFLVFFIGPLIEALIVSHLISLKESKKIHLFLLTYYFFINLLTIPITQVIVIFLSDSTGSNLYFVAEVFPILIEFLALVVFFMYFKSRLKKQYSLKYLFLMAVLSNLFTILFGVFLFFIVS